MYVLAAAAYTWCPYRIIGLTQVLYRSSFNSFLSELLLEISGYNFRNAGCASLARSVMAGAQDILLSRVRPRYFTFGVQSIFWPSIITCSLIPLCFLEKVMACVLLGLIFSLQFFADSVS